MTIDEFRAIERAKRLGNGRSRAIGSKIAKAANSSQLVGTALRRARALAAKVDTADHAARVRIAEIARAEARRMLRKQR